MVHAGYEPDSSTDMSEMLGTTRLPEDAASSSMPIFCRTSPKDFNNLFRAPTAATPLASSAASSRTIMSLHERPWKHNVYLCNLMVFNQAGISFSLDSVVLAVAVNSVERFGPFPLPVNFAPFARHWLCPPCAWFCLLLWTLRELGGDCSIGCGIPIMLGYAIPLRTSCIARSWASLETPGLGTIPKLYGLGMPAVGVSIIRADVL